MIVYIIITRTSSNHPDRASDSPHPPFALHLVWREPKECSSDSSSCSPDIRDITSKYKHKVKYPDLPSAMRPVPHSEELPVPKTPENPTCSSDDTDSEEDHGY